MSLRYAGEKKKICFKFPKQSNFAIGMEDFQGQSVTLATVANVASNPRNQHLPVTVATVTNVAGTAEQKKSILFFFQILRVAAT